MCVLLLLLPFSCLYSLLSPEVSGFQWSAFISLPTDNAPLQFSSSKHLHLKIMNAQGYRKAVNKRNTTRNERFLCTQVMQHQFKCLMHSCIRCASALTLWTAACS